VEEPPDNTNIVVRSQIEFEILLWLLERCDDINGWPWRPMEEVIGRTADPIVALDALAGLCAVGLIRRAGGNVMVTIAAVRFAQLTANQPRPEWVRPTA
jgi:hypothetical protein